MSKHHKSPEMTPPEMPEHVPLDVDELRGMNGRRHEVHKALGVIPTLVVIDHSHGDPKNYREDGLDPFARQVPLEVSKWESARDDGAA